MSSYIGSEYRYWDMNAGHYDEGACVATVEMDRDLVTAGSSLVAPLLSTRRSNIVAMMLLNPETDAFMPLNLTSDKGVEYLMFIEGDFNETAYTLEVRALHGKKQLFSLTRCSVKCQITLHCISRYQILSAIILTFTQIACIVT